MKKYYVLLIILFTTIMCFSQGYEFGIVHNTANNFKVVAIPDFNSSGNTDISSVGFTLMLPAGNSDVINATGLLGGRPWTVNSNADASVLTNYGGNGTQDAFLITLDPGQTIVAHSIGDQIDLVSFDVSNLPSSGLMEFLLNTDVIAMNLNGALDSFYNSDIDGPGNGAGTTDYFSGLAAGMGNFDFSTLGTKDLQLLNSISIYPNPTKNTIKIEGIDDNEISKIDVYSINGRLVKTFNSNLTVLNVSKLQSGIYLIKISVDSKTKTIKFAKQ